MSTKLIDCKICKKRIVAKVWKTHIIGKKHIHYTPKTITVTGNFNPNQVDAVHQYFASFGRISHKNVSIENDTVSIDYSFQDKRLTISWEEVTVPPPFATPARRNRNLGSPQNEKIPGEGVNRQVNRKIDSDTCKQFIINSVREAATFDEQIYLLYSKLQVDQFENDYKRQLIHNDLNSALAPTFPLSCIYFFGSTVTGLDIQGSDLDVYIDNVKEEHKPEIQTLKLIRNLIFKCRKFCDVLLISGAKIPIIKCIHTKTQMCCDVTIRNKLSVCNSQLIRYYLSLDEKLKILMIVIKFWADCNDLKKVNFFSSYALYMMIIFYLQHGPYNFPTVRDLQHDIAPDLIDGWNCAFRILDYSNRALHNESLVNLVTGFFRFYAHFDYTSKVISPYFGAAIDKTCFLQPYDLVGYAEYKMNKQDLNMSSGICIQDPFEHSRNVSAVVPFQCTGRFVVLCQKATKMIERDGHDLLYNLLTHKPSLDYTFCLEKPQDKNENEWMQLVTDITMKVLTKICAVKMVKTMNTNPVIYTCTSEQNIWDGRINILKNLLNELPPETMEIDREIAATKCMTKYLQQPLPISFSMDMNFKENPCRVEYTLKPLKKCKNFLHAIHFFKVRLEKCLNYLENEEIRSDVKQEQETSLVFLSPSQLNMTQKDEKVCERNKDDVLVSEELVNKMSSHVPEPQPVELDTGTGIDKVEEHPIEEEEDVPADFFDDFSNQDFMDGLDIVDAWDDDKVLENEKQDSQEKKKAHSPIVFSSTSPERRKKRSGSKSSRKLKKSVSDAVKRTRSKSHEKIFMSDRRDPEKTRRDINMDKLKCAKHKEQKLVNDKLKIVETGLVPPGMEMETDLSTVLVEKRRKLDTRNSTERVKDCKVSNSEKSREQKTSRELKLSRERERRYNTRRSGSRETRKFLKYSPSPVYKSRIREPIHRSRKRTSSVDSNISDREMWIRRKRTRSRSRSKDSSHRRSKSKKYEEKKKKTFLEEIRDKLNETTRPIVSIPPVPVTYNMTYNHPPAPVPAPQYFPPQPNNVQYDQSFFIGESYQNVSMNQQMGFNMIHADNMVPVGQNSLQEVQPPPAPLIKSQAMVSPKINVLSDIRMNSVDKDIIVNANEDIGKLFADKKISLSDFLTITAKCEVQSSSPEHLQKKIKVISRCQDAIKSMSDDRNFIGRLTIKPTEQKTKNEIKYQSPLRRIPVVRFQFTTPSKNSEESDRFATALDKILQKVGVLKECVGTEICNESVAKLTKSIDEETAALTLKASILKGEARSECEECKRRKSIMFVNVGAQCVDYKETASIAIQVSEEDLSPMKGLSKSDSIAYLTPAQLLGKDKDKIVEQEPEGKVEQPEKSNTEPLLNSPIKKNKAIFKTRGGFRKNIREQPAPHPNYYDYDYEYDYEDEGYDFYNRPAFDEPVASYGRRYGDLPVLRAPQRGSRFPRQFMESENLQPMSRVHQFQEDANFTNFSQSYKGRGDRYGGPRY